LENQHEYGFVWRDNPRKSCILLGLLLAEAFKTSAFRSQFGPLIEIGFSVLTVILRVQ